MLPSRGSRVQPPSPAPGFSWRGSSLSLKDHCHREVGAAACAEVYLLRPSLSQPVVMCALPEE
jgi:hypothetical protein